MGGRVGRVKFGSLNVHVVEEHRGCIRISCRAAIQAAIAAAVVRHLCAAGRRYALLYFLPLIISQILGKRHDRAAGEAGTPGGDGDNLSAGTGTRKNGVEM